MSNYNKNNVKFLSVISYIGPLFLVAKFSLEKNYKLVKFHRQQGEILFFTMSTLLIITSAIDFTITFSMEALSIICFLLYIGITVAWLILSIMGIISALSEDLTPLPLIGELTAKIKKDKGDHYNESK